jgi:hypothetical protein
MKNFDWRIVWGALLVILGLVFMLQSLGILGGGLALLWALVFAAAGAAFLYVFITNHEHWWAVIPGFTLLGLALLVALGSVNSDFAEALGGAFFMAGISAAFWVIYVRNRDYWWAIIPGGVLLTLAAIILFSEILPEGIVGGLFFWGLAGTFLLVRLLPNPEGAMDWALIPAGVLGVLGLVVIVASSAVMRWAWPLLLILGGAYLIVRTLWNRNQ